MKKQILIALVLLGLVALIDAKVQKGKISSNAGNWVPVTQFYFSSAEKGTPQRGQFEWVVNTDDNSGNLSLLIYDDEDSSWPSIYKKRNSLSCWEKASKAKNNISIFNGETRLELISEGHPRIWYVVIADCNNEQFSLTYDFKFYNKNHKSGAYYQQFSLEQQGYFGLNLAFFFFFLVLIAIHAKGVFTLYSAGAYHFTIKLLTATIVLEFFAVMFQLINNAKYAKDGMGSAGCSVISHLLGYGSQLCLLYLVLLLSRGFVVSHTEIPDKMRLYIATGILFVIYFIFFIWRTVEAHKVLYPMFLWGSAPGIILLIIRVLTLVYFLYNIRNSHATEGHPTKRQFYLIFGLIAMIWFLWLPFNVIMSALVNMNKHWRLEMGVSAPYMLINFAFLCIMSFLFWPSRISKYFEVAQSDLLIGTSSSSPYETL